MKINLTSDERHLFLASQCLYLLHKQRSTTHFSGRQPVTSESS